VVLTASAVRNGTQRDGKTDHERVLGRSRHPHGSVLASFPQLSRRPTGEVLLRRQGVLVSCGVGREAIPVVWGYPWTCWWLKYKGRGDDIEVLIEAKADRPEAVKQLVQTNLAAVGQHPMASVLAEGGAPYARFSINGAEPKPFDELVRQAITALFAAES
jgi:hypothetical protein